MLARPTSVTLRSGRRVDLRSPTRSDAAALLAYMRQLTRESSRNLNHPPEHFDAMTVEQEAAFLDGMERHPTSLMVNAWLEGRAIGGAGVHTAPGTFKAHTGEVGLGALAAYHGEGLGRALLEHVIAEATRAGVTHLVLHVRTFNDVAIRLYEKAGFVRVGTLHGAAKLPDGLHDEHVYERIAP
jgi:RimJ/RimL family protein N-acetyltransferase